MPYDCGINFRGSASYVTDGANETYCLGTSDAYPTTRGGHTFGWSSSAGSLDRNAGLDRRLAGTNYVGKSATTTYFRLDLDSAGAHDIHIAMGDNNNAANCGLLCRDGVGSTIFELTGDTSGARKFKDATNTEYTDATWPNSETPVSHTFTSDYVTLIVSSAASSNSVKFVKISHLRIVSVASAAERVQSRSQMGLHEPRAAYQW